ncbi:MAG: DegT/DnrJ/EryC1/StrS family aminotransferase [Bdellovibrionales bacterium]
MTPTELKIDFPGIQTRLTNNEVDQIAEVIKTSKTHTMGPRLKEFEEKFAQYIGTKYAVGLTNATAALELAAQVGGVQEGDEVLLPAHTFTASALPFLKRKCKLVFVDIDPKTWVMDMADFEKKITSNTRAVVAVHLYGLPLDMDRLMPLVQKNNLLLIEDCAQAVGAKYKGRRIGSFGHFSCFSFHSQKNLPTLGEGGMLTTNSSEAYETILGLRKIGARPFKNQEKYWLPAMTNIIEAMPGEFPANYALTEIQSFAGTLILSRLDQLTAQRKKQFDYIATQLKDFPEIQFQKVEEGYESAYHLLPARYEGSGNGKNRNDLIELLYNKYGVKCVTQYLPLYNYELFQKNGYTQKTCPVSDKFFDQMISIPFWSDMEQDKLELLTQSLRSALQELRS